MFAPHRRVEQSHEEMHAYPRYGLWYILTTRASVINGDIKCNHDDDNVLRDARQGPRTSPPRKIGRRPMDVRQ